MKGEKPLVIFSSWRYVRCIRVISSFLYVYKSYKGCLSSKEMGRRGGDRMIVGFTTTYAISVYHHWRCEFESRSWRGVIDTTLCDNICQWLAAGQWFPLRTPVYSNNKPDRHDMTEILLKVALSTITINIIWRDYVNSSKTNVITK